REASPGTEAAPETSAVPRESQAEENAFAQQFFGKNYDQLTHEELQTLHNARLHEETPELFGKEEIPFNLRGEGLSEEVGTEGQARAKVQAEHEQKKAQSSLFGRAGIERAKEAGGVPLSRPVIRTRPAGAPF